MFTCNVRERHRRQEVYLHPRAVTHLRPTPRFTYQMAVPRVASARALTVLLDQLYLWSDCPSTGIGPYDSTSANCSGTMTFFRPIKPTKTYTVTENYTMTIFGTSTDYTPPPISTPLPFL
jgi:hypothetical protein